jgi:hypothetical protein
LSFGAVASAEGQSKTVRFTKTYETRATAP